MKLHHIGIVVDNVKSAIQRYRAMFGLIPTTEIVIDPIQKVSVVMLSDPEADSIPLELIAPLTDDSPVSGILKGKMRLYHLCFLVDDIEKALKNFRNNGSHIISSAVPADLFEGKKIAFVYVPDKFVVELLEK